MSEIDDLCGNAVRIIAEKLSDLPTPEADEAMFILGGALAQLMKNLAEHLQSPSIPDAFMEGFASYSRFYKKSPVIERDSLN